MWFTSLFSFLASSWFWHVKATVFAALHVKTWSSSSFTWLHYFWEQVVYRLFGKLFEFSGQGALLVSITEACWGYNFEKLLLPLVFIKSECDFLHRSLHPCKGMGVSPLVISNQTEQSCQVREPTHRNSSWDVLVSLFSVCSKDWTWWSLLLISMPQSS